MWLEAGSIKASLAVSALLPPAVISSPTTVVPVVHLLKTELWTVSTACEVGGRQEQPRPPACQTVFPTGSELLPHLCSPPANSAGHSKALSLLCTVPPACQGLCLLILAKNLPGDTSQLLFILSPHPAAPQKGCGLHLTPMTSRESQIL